MTKKIAICWFRQDLRLYDNKALFEASKNENILPIYILDDENSKKYKIGSASRLWLHYSLKSLKKSLGGKLSVYSGNPEEILVNILNRHEVEAIYWNRCYEPWRIKRDSKIKTHLKNLEIQVNTYNSSLLWEPWNIKKDDGTPYKVFTPFYRKGCLNAQEPSIPLSKPDRANYLFDKDQIGVVELNLLPRVPWGKKLKTHWDIGEEGAHRRFDQFIEEGLSLYKEGRNIPAKPYVSRLSPHLHFGEISSNQLWHSVRSIGDNKNIEHFCSELGWREFSYSQLFNNPRLPEKNLQSKFDFFPWNENETFLKAWQKGNTGIPMVDAGMRELWQTGYMHNRVRMIVGSFLVKNLRLHWHHGERWFWDTLVDADLANNSASWQWIAGCGADAAPYFRIFNPIMQGQKFDPNGDYVRQYIPEIAALPNKYLFNPWEASEDILSEASIELGSTYPKPIVDLKQSRELALSAFQSLKQLDNKNLNKKK
tara:strand:- start:2880 stop:4322 length:1443 start_codon:yes stop_codon:yes gene_type:complete